MTPRRIIDEAIKKGLDIIAISDHNTAENVSTAINIAHNKGIKVLPAIEITSLEEVHILAVFDSLESVLKMQDIIYDNLPSGKNDERLLGYQLVVNEQDEIISFNKRLFFSATMLDVRSLTNIIHSLNGIAIASHIDKEIFSIISQLGFLPEDIKFDGLEISRNISKKKAEEMFSMYSGIQWITSSDAHHLVDIGKRSVSFFLKEPSFDEIKRAFKGERIIEWQE